jgi:hypothetical protein
MRKAFGIVVVLFAACAIVANLTAADKDSSAKEVTLKGTILCAKCELKETDKCVTAIQVKEDKKTVTYYFDDSGDAEKYHSDVCGGGEKAGTVTGVVTKKDGKMWIKPTKVEYTKK